MKSAPGTYTRLHELVFDSLTAGLSGSITLAPSTRKVYRYAPGSIGPIVASQTPLSPLVNVAAEFSRPAMSPADSVTFFACEAMIRKTMCRSGVTSGEITTGPCGPIARGGGGGAAGGGAFWASPIGASSTPVSSTVAKSRIEFCGCGINVLHDSTRCCRPGLDGYRMAAVCYTEHTAGGGMEALRGQREMCNVQILPSVRQEVLPPASSITSQRNRSTSSAVRRTTPTTRRRVMFSPAVLIALDGSKASRKGESGNRQGTARKVPPLRRAPDLSTSGDCLNSGSGWRRCSRTGAKAGCYASCQEYCRERNRGLNEDRRGGAGSDGAKGDAGADSSGPCQVLAGRD